jgi:hypothetical protein
MQLFHGARFRGTVSKPLVSTATCLSVALAEEALKLQRPLPDGLLKIEAIGLKKDDVA